MENPGQSSRIYSARPKFCSRVSEQPYMTINLNPGKTEALCISLHPRVTARKATPYVHINNTMIRYNKNPYIFGITFDSQLSFNAQAKKSADKLKKRTRILQALAGRNWGLTAIDLTTLYKNYARSGGTYASGVWFNFLADSWADKLESANYQAARVITGIPRGSPIHPTCIILAGSQPASYQGPR